MVHGAAMRRETSGHIGPGGRVVVAAPGPGQTRLERIESVAGRPALEPSWTVSTPPRPADRPIWSGSRCERCCCKHGPAQRSGGPGRHRATRLASTLGADKACNVADFIVRLRKIKGKRPMSGAEKGFDGREVGQAAAAGLSEAAQCQGSRKPRQPSSRVRACSPLRSGE